MGNLLDALLGVFAVQADGVALPRRRTVNFSGLTVTDDPTNERTNVVGPSSGGGYILPGKIVTAPSYTIDSGPTKDSLIFMDWSANDIAITLPPHAAGVFRLIIFKASKYAPGHGVTILRNGGTGKINHIAQDLALSYLRDYTWLCSNGVDDWCDLVVTGT